MHTNATAFCNGDGDDDDDDDDDNDGISYIFMCFPW